MDAILLTDERGLAVPAGYRGVDRIDGIAFGAAGLDGPEMLGRLRQLPSVYEALVGGTQWLRWSSSLVAEIESLLSVYPFSGDASDVCKLELCVARETKHAKFAGPALSLGFEAFEVPYCWSIVSNAAEWGGALRLNQFGLCESEEALGEAWEAYLRADDPYYDNRVEWRLAEVLLISAWSRRGDKWSRTYPENGSGGVRSAKP